MYYQTPCQKCTFMHNCHFGRHSPWYTSYTIHYHLRVHDGFIRYLYRRKSEVLSSLVAILSQPIPKVKQGYTIRNLYITELNARMIACSRDGHRGSCGLHPNRRRGSMLGLHQEEWTTNSFRTKHRELHRHKPGRARQED